LNRCVELKYEKDDKGRNEVKEIHYDYQFLDDYITPQPTLNAFMADMFKWQAAEDKHDEVVGDAEEGTRYAEDIPLDDVRSSTVKTPTVKSTQYVDSENKEEKKELESDNWMQPKFDQKNHPLELMVNVNC